MELLSAKYDQILANVVGAPATKQISARVGSTDKDDQYKI